MAAVSGTATNFADLYNKLRNFLTSNTTLVGLGQNWTQIAGPTGTLTGNGDWVVLQGPGLAGDDQVLICLHPYSDSVSQTYNLSVMGFVAYNPALDILAQVNSSTRSVLPTFNQPIGYWFIANGRRFIVVARVSTYWMTLYAGLILPNVLPDAWPYPLYVGGSNAGSGTGAQQNWQTTGQSVRAFWNGYTGCGKILLPDVLWYDTNNWANSSGDGAQTTGVNVNPFRWDLAEVMSNIDGSMPLEQAVIVSDTPYAAQLGRFEGLFRCPALGNAAGNIIQVGGVDHIVVQNVYRTARYDYAAIALQ